MQRSAHPGCEGEPGSEGPLRVGQAQQAGALAVEQEDVGGRARVLVREGAMQRPQQRRARSRRAGGARQPAAQRARLAAEGCHGGEHLLEQRSFSGGVLCSGTQWRSSCICPAAQRCASAGGRCQSRHQRRQRGGAAGGSGVGGGAACEGAPKRCDEQQSRRGRGGRGSGGGGSPARARQVRQHRRRHARSASAAQHLRCMKLSADKTRAMMPPQPSARRVKPRTWLARRCAPSSGTSSASASVVCSRSAAKTADGGARAGNACSCSVQEPIMPSSTHATWPATALAVPSSCLRAATSAVSAAAAAL